MSRFVIDSPTLLNALDNDLPIDPAHRLVAPNSIRSEVMQLLLDDVRRGGRTEAAALAIHERMTELKMRLLGDRVSRGVAWKIAREHGWDSIHPAEYIAITRLQADALVTVDPRLAELAAGLVPLASIEALIAGS